ncbi:hypothetical protein OH77DRAFT_1594451 [Trametes cingulata]|nr:hypothetical protein OH77DRAFT_1594451 [Trametes cingulata]
MVHGAIEGPVQFSHLPAELTRKIVDEADMESILSVRKVSRDLHDHAAASLTADRERILSYYVDDAETLLAYLDEYDAIVGGYAALSFVLRDPGVLPVVLEIYAGQQSYDLLEHFLEEDPELDLEYVSATNMDDDEGKDELERCVLRSTLFRCANGRQISILCADSLSSLEPIVASWTTALVNWFSSSAFGCGYPALTLTRRALCPNWDDLGRILRHRRLHLELCTNFEVASHATEWPEYEDRACRRPFMQTLPCLRKAFMCPRQTRYFGDGGSIVTVFDLLGADIDGMRRHRLAPYGITVAWRRFSRYGCDHDCGSQDPILPPEMVVVPVAFIDHENVKLRGTRCK